jgi:hypothetical protein
MKQVPIKLPPIDAHESYRWRRPEELTVRGDLYAVIKYVATFPFPFDHVGTQAYSSPDTISNKNVK